MSLGSLAVAAVVAIAISQSTDISPAASRALFILLLAASLWITEAIPAYAVGILIIGLEIALLGRPGGVYAQTPTDWEAFAAVLGHPLVWMFFGGFVLAAGMSRCGLDRWLAGRVLSQFGERPPLVLLGVMLVTALLSMFMSNTATTALLLAMLLPVVTGLGKRDRFGVGLLLGITVAANVGGMASLIGTPPNAIAVGALAEIPGLPPINFLDWIVVGMPPAAVVMFAAWGVLVKLYPSSGPTISLGRLLGSEPAAAGPTRTSQVAIPRWHAPVVAITMVATLVMWLTSHWHAIPAAAVAFLPMIVFTSTGILGVADIRSLPYDVLFLMAGGLALGNAITATGLSEWLVSYLPTERLSPWMVALVFAYTTALLSNFMSNTAAATMLVPIGISLASTLPVETGILVALAASSGVCMPVSTPPNAMVHSSGRVASRDFLCTGLLILVLVPAVGAAWLWLLSRWGFIG